MSVFIQEVLGLLKRNKKQLKLDSQKDYLEIGRLYQTSSLNNHGGTYAPRMEPFAVKYGDLKCDILTNVVLQDGVATEHRVPMYSSTAVGTCLVQNPAIKDSIMIQNAVADSIIVNGNLNVDENLQVDKNSVLKLNNTLGTSGDINHSTALLNVIHDSTGAAAGAENRVLRSRADGRVLWSDDDPVVALPYGNIWLGNSSNIQQPLPPGAANTILVSNGTTLSYSSFWGIKSDVASGTMEPGETLWISGDAKINTGLIMAGGNPEKILIDHDDTTRTDTTTNASPGFGGTFTVVDTITQDVTGHPTAVNVKTVSIPANPVPANNVTGSGTINNVAMFTATGSVIGDGAPVPMVWSSGNLSIGTDVTQQTTVESILNIQGPVKDSSSALAGSAGKVLKSNATNQLVWSDDTGVTTLALALTTGQTTPLTGNISGTTLNLFSNKFGGGDQVGYVPSAAAGTDSTKFLKGDGTWATPAGAGTMSSWRLTGDNATITNVIDNNLVTIEGGAKLTTAAALTDTVTIDHDNTTRTDTTTAVSPAAGGTFTVIDSVTQDATGHPTAVNVKTVTLPTSGGGSVTSVGLSMPAAFTVTNSPVTGSGTLTVAGAGTTSQFIDGTGALQTISTGTVTSVTEGAGITISGTSSAPIVAIDYLGADNAILEAPSEDPTDADFLWFSDTSDSGNIKKEAVAKFLTQGSFTVTDGSSPQTIALGDTLTVAAANQASTFGGLTVNTTTTDTITIGVDIAGTDNLIMARATESNPATLDYYMFSDTSDGNTLKKQQIYLMPGFYNGFTLQADTNPAQVVNTDENFDIAGGTGLTTVITEASTGSGPLTTNTVTINHTDSITAGTSAHPSSITVNASGHITAITAGSAPSSGTVTSVTAGEALEIESGSSTVNPTIGVKFVGADNLVKVPGAGSADIADEILFNDADDSNTVKRVAISSLPLVTSLTAGTGCSEAGSGTTGILTLNVGAGAGLKANADDIAVEYVGTSSVIQSATNASGSIPDGADLVIYQDVDDGNKVKYTEVKNLVVSDPGPSDYFSFNTSGIANQGESTYPGNNLVSYNSGTGLFTITFNQTRPSANYLVQCTIVKNMGNAEILSFVTRNHTTTGFQGEVIGTNGTTTVAGLKGAQTYEITCTMYQ